MYSHKGLENEHKISPEDINNITKVPYKCIYITVEKHVPKSNINNANFTSSISLKCFACLPE